MGWSRAREEGSGAGDVSRRGRSSRASLSLQGAFKYHPPLTRSHWRVSAGERRSDLPLRLKRVEWKDEDRTGGQKTS